MKKTNPVLDQLKKQDWCQTYQTVLLKRRPVRKKRKKIERKKNKLKQVEIRLDFFIIEVNYEN